QSSDRTQVLTYITAPHTHSLSLPDGSSDLTIGRPVRFAGGGSPEADALAADRLLRAARAAGFDDARLEFEPVAAAYHYERTLTRDRKSTRLNSSHVKTSYAVLCLKKTII